MTALELANPLRAPVHRLGLASAVASTGAINLLSLALPIATLQIYDRVLQGRNESTLHVLVVGVIAALLLETLLRIIRSYIICHRGAAYAHGVSCAAINQQLDARIAAGENRAVATDLAGLSAVKSMKDFNNGYSTIVLIDLLFLPLFIAVIAYISHTLVLIPVVLLCAFGLIIALSGLRVRNHMEDGSSSDDRRNDFIIDTLMASQFVKSYALEKLLQRRFDNLHTSSCMSSYWLSRSITESVVYSSALGHLMTAATVAAGAYLAVQDNLSVGALIAAVQLSSRLMQPVQQAVLLWIRFHGHEAAKAKAERLFDVPAAPTVTNIDMLRNDGRVDLEHVAFRPQPHLPLLFEGVTFSLDRGEALIIDGATGSGKTVLLKMIAGIYAASSGRVKVNGSDVSGATSADIARNVAYLAPRAALLRGTIRDNITRFNQVPVSQSLALAKYIGLKAEFDRLPMGIDTVVGAENDMNVSPGLVQMISLLRVLSSKPRIILFDDADNGVDTNYYNSLIALLGKIKPNVAMIIVSRDMNIRQLADRRMVLSEGRLVETDFEFTHKKIKLPGI